MSTTSPRECIAPTSLDLTRFVPSSLGACASHVRHGAYRRYVSRRSRSVASRPMRASGDRPTIESWAYHYSSRWMGGFGHHGPVHSLSTKAPSRRPSSL